MFSSLRSLWPTPTECMYSAMRHTRHSPPVSGVRAALTTLMHAHEETTVGVEGRITGHTLGTRCDALWEGALYAVSALRECGAKELKGLPSDGRAL